jgi:Flp pilus assembly secretin CpaC
MTCKTLFFKIALALGATIGGLVPTDRALAAEPNNAGMKVTGNDATASFMELGTNKSVVIDLPSDIQDVLITDPKTVNAVVKTKRRVYIIGMAPGQTNVFFFAADGQQVGALDIAVRDFSPRSPQDINPSMGPANVITVFRGEGATPYSCTSTECIGAQKPDTTSYSQVTFVNK